MEGDKFRNRDTAKHGIPQLTDDALLNELKTVPAVDRKCGFSAAVHRCEQDCYACAIVALCTPGRLPFIVPTDLSLDNGYQQAVVRWGKSRDRRSDPSTTAAAVPNTVSALSMKVRETPAGLIPLTFVRIFSAFVKNSPGTRLHAKLLYHRVQTRRDPQYVLFSSSVHRLDALPAGMLGLHALQNRLAVLTMRWDLQLSRVKLVVINVHRDLFGTLLHSILFLLILFFNCG